MTDYPPAAFRFSIQLDGAGQDGASFQEVGGIASEIDTDADREGGESRFVHALPKGVKHPKLILRRGLADRRSQLIGWCRDVLEGGLSKPLETRDLTVCLLDETNVPLRTWSFRNAYPVKWEVDPFQADKDNVAIEKLELAYSASLRTL